MTQADDEHILELVHRWHEARSRGESRSIDEICGDRADLVPAVEQQVQHIAAFDFLDGKETVDEYLNVSKTADNGLNKKKLVDINIFYLSRT